MNVSKKVEDTIKQKDKELEFIAFQLNAIYSQAEPLRKEYASLMYYYRTLMNRGQITREEYEERKNMFKHSWKDFGVAYNNLKKSK